ncbi:MAG TPA: alginate lyase family protein [Flavisolibacter sp.]|nr:alginate lyase family protein [Flavisolibacter sp.]
MKIQPVLFAWLAGLFLVKASAQQTPAVFSLDPAILTANKKKVGLDDPALSPAYKQLLKDADKALKQGPFSVMEKKNLPPSGDKHDYMSLAPYHWPDPSKPNGLPYIRKDGQTNPEVKEYKDKEYMPKLCELVNTLGQAYYFSGDERYAEHASRLLSVWFLDAETRMNPNLKYAQAIKGVNEGRGAGLIDSRHFIKLIDAIGLLNGSRHWKAKHQQGMKQWFASFLDWMQTSKNGISEMNASNNHGTWYDAQRLAMALFIDSTSLAKSIVQNALLRLDQQMDNEGKFPEEMERTIALHYNVFDLEAFFLIAKMAEKLDMNVWNHETKTGKSLKKGFLFLFPYITKQKDWIGQQIKPYEFEEGYPLLLTAAAKLNCTQCAASVRNLEEEADRLRLWLLY